MHLLSMLFRKSLISLYILFGFAFCLCLTSCDEVDSASEGNSEPSIVASTNHGSNTEAAKTETSSSNGLSTSGDISKLQVSRYEESEMDGAASYHVYSNVGESDANLAAFREDCIVGVAHAFNIPIEEATSYVDRALAGESRVVIKDKYYSYTLTFEVNSIVNKQGAYALNIHPDTIGWLDW